MPLTLPARWQTALESLTARPLVLVSALLLACALVHPYRGLFHDARLYAAQVTERVSPGSLSDDLFLRYGSQDRYTIFTPLVAPLVRQIGLEPAFFVVYLLSKALFFWALVRLVLVLIPDRLAALLALIYLAMAPLPFGGNEVFHLNEAFLTPRIAASALVLIALERALARRPGQAAGLLALALLLHPLMAFGGALVIGLWWMFAWLSWRWLTGLADGTILAGCAVAFYEPLGLLLFGYMAPEWRQVERHLCFFTNPAWWTLGDWWRIAGCVAVVCAASRLWLRQQTPLLAALLAAAVLGMAGSVVAACSNYRLLIQASPYRAIWLLELLAVPVGFAGALWLWRRAPWWSRALGVVMLVLLTVDWNMPPFNPLGVFLLVAPIVVNWQRGLRRTPNAPDWLDRSVTMTTSVGVLLLLAVDLHVLVFLFRAKPDLSHDLHPVAVLQNASEVLHKPPLVLLFALGLLWAVLPRGEAARSPRPRLALALALVALAYQGALTWLEAAPWYRMRFSVAARHEQFICDFVHQKARQSGRRPSIYWPTNLRDVWFRAGARCYFNSAQLSGCAFNEGTALEGRQRAWRVRCFEAEGLRRHPTWPWWHKALSGFYDAPSARPPSRDDLLALCLDEEVDFVIVPERFEGWYCATDGAYYVYDCASVRRLPQ
jgi:hypothetical protein